MTTVLLVCAFVVVAPITLWCGVTGYLITFRTPRPHRR